MHAGMERERPARIGARRASERRLNVSRQSRAARRAPPALPEGVSLAGALHANGGCRAEGSLTPREARP